ncbi:NUDIX domain protein [Orientia chuto str. Dubai]|uniref:RNA pyrophosphohydrolase n=1 Tax=Orientia chuto str. Dubai TaxID=1359168 RepID=A0A0F3MK69_9RICK|nr:RNA pyrophosphohydrolase [Candidatus Orientia mediorientalis]KJV55867.1 NUDIX domain protein [Orientia chuto str. Dubai]
MDNVIRNYNNLPYRIGVGMVIINHNKEIFTGKRIDSLHQCWQMPQGGVILGETYSKAVLREMKEEIGCNKAIILAESKNWYSYYIPKFLVPKLWNSKFKGQKQKWFLIKFLGKNEDININTKYPEFSQWKWMHSCQLINNTLPFKRKLYMAVIKEFNAFFR